MSPVKTGGCQGGDCSLLLKPQLLLSAGLVQRAFRRKQMSNLFLKKRSLLLTASLPSPGAATLYGTNSLNGTFREVPGT